MLLLIQYCLLFFGLMPLVERYLSVLIQIQNKWVKWFDNYNLIVGEYSDYFILVGDILWKRGLVFKPNSTTTARRFRKKKDLFTCNYWALILDINQCRTISFCQYLLKFGNGKSRYFANHNNITSAIYLLKHISTVFSHWRLWCHVICRFWHKILHSIQKLWNYLNFGTG